MYNPNSTTVLELPTLYKKTATGAIQQWTVSVTRKMHLETAEVGVVVTTYGQVDGQLQTTEDTVYEGKNLGKKNATTALEQAKAQAQQHWDKKKKQGYTEDLALASTTDNVLDAIKPMLAHVYEDHPKKIVWPAFVQPKLDGMRCIAIVSGGVAKLYSRTQKLIETVPHINKALEILSGGEDHIFDGELYTHKLSANFNKIMSILKRDEIHPDHEQIQYHVYDLPSHTDVFSQRIRVLEDLFKSLDDSSPLCMVETVYVPSEEEMFARMEQAIEAGYEGVMYRRPGGEYEGKRSHGLLKVKTFRDEEFEVFDVEEGNGKLQGKAGAIWCITKDGKKFKAKMQGALDTLTDYLRDFEKYRTMKLTVKFQNYTPDGVPRFPVGIRFREAE